MVEYACVRSWSSKVHFQSVGALEFHSPGEVIFSDVCIWTDLQWMKSIVMSPCCHSRAFQRISPIKARTNIHVSHQTPVRQLTSHLHVGFWKFKFWDKWNEFYFIAKQKFMNCVYEINWWSLEMCVLYTSRENKCYTEGEYSTLMSVTYHLHLLVMWLCAKCDVDNVDWMYTIDWKHHKHNILYCSKNILHYYINFCLRTLIRPLKIVLYQHRGLW